MDQILIALPDFAIKKVMSYFPHQGHVLAILRTIKFLTSP